jgi:CBS domain-containing protein
MSISKLCSRKVVCATPTTTVAEAAEMMRHHHIGNVVVVDSRDGTSRPLGIVTDRDIVIEVVAPGLDPKGIRLSDLVQIQGPIETVEEGQSFAYAARMMAVRAVRRLPVVDKEGALVGIVSVDDMLPELAAQLTALADVGSRGRQHETQTRK